MIKKELSKEEYIVKAAKLYGVEDVEVEALKNHLQGDMKNAYLERRNEMLFKLYDKYKRGDNKPLEVYAEEGFIDLDEADILLSRKKSEKTDFGRYAVITPDLDSFIAKSAIPFDIVPKLEKIAELNDILLPQIAKSMGVPATIYYRSKYTTDTGIVSTNHLTKNFLNDEEVLIQGNKIIKQNQTKSKKDKTDKKVLSSKIKMSHILEATDKYIKKYYQKYRIPEKEQKADRDEIRQALIKHFFVNKFLVNDNDSLVSWGLIEDKKNHRLRVAPMTRFNYCAGVKCSSKDAKHVVVSHGKEDMQSFMAEFGKEQWFRLWIKDKVLNTNFRNCVFKMEKDSKVKLSEEELSYYKFFFDNMIEDVRMVHELDYDKDEFPKKSRFKNKVKNVKEKVKSIVTRKESHEYDERI